MIRQLSYPLLTALFLAATSLIVGQGGTSFGQQSPPKPKLVRLIIDYNDGVEKHFTRLAWTKDMTVLDAMKQAQRSPHGITFRYTGRGATAFLTQIDDLKNQGGGKKNWLYRVNGKLASKGFGVYVLEADDVVNWKFQQYRFKKGDSK